MEDTIVRIITESGKPVTFIVALNLQVVLNDIEGASSGPTADSGTTIAALLQLGKTRPVLSAEDLRLATVIYSSRDRVLKWCYEGQNKSYHKNLRKALLNNT